MTDLAVVPQPGDPHARPGNHPKENTVITDEMVDAFSRASAATWRASAPISLGEATVVDRNAVRAGLVAALTDLRDLISDFVDFGPDPCRYDHHGYCQAHGWMATEPRCPYARAKELLGEAQP